MSDTLEAPVQKMKFRVIKEAGKPVGPHVDFARDEKGEIVYGKPYVEGGHKMPGDPVERVYYPGDVIESTTDLTQFNGGGDGKCKSKFERVYESEVASRESVLEGVTVEEAKAIIARAEAATSSPPSTVPPQGSQPPQGQRTKLSEEVLRKKSYNELVEMARVEAVDLKGVTKKEEVIAIILKTLNG